MCLQLHTSQVCFCPQTFFENYRLNSLLWNCLVSCLHSQAGYSTRLFPIRWRHENVDKEITYLSQTTHVLLDLSNAIGYGYCGKLKYNLQCNVTAKIVARVKSCGESHFCFQCNGETRSYKKGYTKWKNHFHGLQLDHMPTMVTIVVCAIVNAANKRFLADVGLE